MRCGRGVLLRLRRCVPSLWSREAALIALQSSLLMSRTWLTDYISRLEARAGRHLIGQVGPPAAAPKLPSTLAYPYLQLKQLPDLPASQSPLEVRWGRRALARELGEHLWKDARLVS